MQRRELTRTIRQSISTLSEVGKEPHIGVSVFLKAAVMPATGQIELCEGMIEMEMKKVEKNNMVCAVVRSGDRVIVDAQSALDVLMAAKYDLGTKNIVIDKKLVAEDFFILSSGLAGEILQKYVNYGGRIAIYGDYSHYTSKPLKDFIYESNNGHDVFFVSTEEEAINKLTQ